MTSEAMTPPAHEPRRRKAALLIGVCAAAFILGRSARSSQPAPRPRVVPAAAPTLPVVHRAEVVATHAVDSGIARTENEPEPPLRDLPSRGISEAPVYHPRPPDEWQGMLVNTAMQAICDRSERCGLAMACLSGRCGPCQRDHECASGEACVLDHCLALGNVGCRSARSCRGPEELCVLTGYSNDPRGNASMRSLCQSSRGGRPQRPEDFPTQPASPVPYAPTPVSPTDLLRTLPNP
jgi:hypothetical protein